MMSTAVMALLLMMRKASLLLKKKARIPVLLMIEVGSLLEIRKQRSVKVIIHQKHQNCYINHYSSMLKDGNTNYLKLAFYCLYTLFTLFLR